MGCSGVWNTVTCWFFCCLMYKLGNYCITQMCGLADLTGLFQLKPLHDSTFLLQPVDLQHSLLDFQCSGFLLPDISCAACVRGVQNESEGFKARLGGTWSTLVWWRCPCQWGWNEKVLKVPSYPDHSIILPFFTSIVCPWQMPNSKKHLRKN